MFLPFPNSSNYTFVMSWYKFLKVLWIQSISPIRDPFLCFCLHTGLLQPDEILRFYIEIRRDAAVQSVLHSPKQQQQQQQQKLFPSCVSRSVSSQASVQIQTTALPQSLASKLASNTSISIRTAAWGIRVSTEGVCSLLSVFVPF